MAVGFESVTPAPVCTPELLSIINRLTIAGSPKPVTWCTEPV